MGCLAIRVAAPTIDQVTEAMLKVAEKESQIFPKELAQRIAQKSNRDLRRALLVLESTCTSSGGAPLTKDTGIQEEAWDSAITRVAKMILQEQSPKMAMEVRGKLYELMAACLPADFILKELLLKLIAEQRDDNLKQRAMAAAAHFESTMQEKRKVHGILNASSKICFLVVNGQSFLVIDGSLLNLFWFEKKKKNKKKVLALIPLL